MKEIYKLIFVFILIICFGTSSALFAADGTWIVNFDAATWSLAANWNGDIIADGATYTAAFTNQITGAPRTLSIDGPRTIGNIIFGAGPAFIGYYWYFYGANEITLDNGANTPQLDVNNTVFGAMLACPIGGSNGFDKTGNPYGGLDAYNQIRLYAANTISGNVTVIDGQLGIYNANALQYADVIINNGAIMELGFGITMNGKPITVQAGGKIIAEASGVQGINNDIIAKGEHAYDPSTASSTSSLNGTIELDATGWAGVSVGGQNSVLNINSNIFGIGDLHILGHSTTGTHVQIINFNVPGTYSGGDTRLAAWAASPRFEINVNDALANDVLTLANNTHLLLGPESITLDLNSNTQHVNAFNMDAGGTPPANQYVELNADPAGHLNVANWAKAFNGRCIINGGNHYITPYFGIEANAELVLTNTYVNATSEFLIWGANSTLTIDNGATARNFVTRFTQAPIVSTLNLNSGGKLETARTWTASINPATTSLLNFNGGILSDGIEGEHEGSYTNWLAAGQSNIVMAGGAIIEVNNVNGRQILQPLYHDPVLGVTADGGLTKLGPETLTLNGLNTYTGPTLVQAGSLLVNGSITSSIGITIVPGTKLGGSGTVSDLTVLDGATVAPGTSIGTLNTGELTMGVGSEYDWEVGDTSLGEADLVNVNGALNIGIIANSITVNVFKVSGVTQPGDTMNLYSTSGGVSGNATSIFMDYSSSPAISGPANPAISGNDVIVTGLTPEPAFLGFIVLAALALIRRK